MDTIPAGDTSYTDSVAAPTTELDDDAIGNVNYSYFATFYNTSSGEESRPTSQPISISITETNRRVRIENLPTITDVTKFNSIRIYRNVDNAPESFYEVATLAAGETTFIDNIPDSDITSNDELDRNGPSNQRAGTGKRVDV